MKKVAILALCLCLCGCQRVESVDPLKAAEIAGKLVYVKDGRTGICYATIASQTYGGYLVTSITAVPCDKAGLK